MATMKISNVLVKKIYYTFNYFGNVKYNKIFNTKNECKKYLKEHNLQMLDIVKVKLFNYKNYKCIQHKNINNQDYIIMNNNKNIIQLWNDKTTKLMIIK